MTTIKSLKNRPEEQKELYSLLRGQLKMIVYSVGKHVKTVVEAVLVEVEQRLPEKLLRRWLLLQFLLAKVVQLQTGA